MQLAQKKQTMPNRMDRICRRKRGIGHAVAGTPAEEGEGRVIAVKTAMMICHAAFVRMRNPIARTKTPNRSDGFMVGCGYLSSGVIYSMLRTITRGAAANGGLYPNGCVDISNVLEQEPPSPKKQRAYLHDEINTSTFEEILSQRSGRRFF